MKMTMVDGKMHMESTKATMSGFADMLSRFVGKPVVDMTELKGNYDVTIEVSMQELMAIARTAGVAVPGMGGPAPGGRFGASRRRGFDPSTSGSIFASIQQLGLKLESRKSPVETIVVDKIEKTPTETRLGRNKAAAKRPAIQGKRWIVAGLIAATLAVYAQTAQFDFVNYDDPDYVANNAHVRSGITPEYVCGAFTSTEAANWFPVTRLSHMLDVQVFGLQSGAHHITNVAIHAAAARCCCLHFSMRRRRRCGRARSWRFCSRCTRCTSSRSHGWRSGRTCCARSSGFWRCGPMCGTASAALRGVLSRADVEADDRDAAVRPAAGRRVAAEARMRIREKLPLFALAAAGAVMTYVAQSGSGAVKPVGAPAIANALVSYVVYLAKTFWPARLAVFYPYPSEIPVWQAIAAALALAGVTAAAVPCGGRGLTSWWDGSGSSERSCR